MKIRLDYVSNSSSSSCIIIARSGNDVTESIKRIAKQRYAGWSYYIPSPDRGKNEFGWEFENTRDFWGKLNFLGLQLLYLLAVKFNGSHTTDKWYRGEDPNKFTEHYKMLKRVCKERFGLDVCLNQEALEVQFYESSFEDGADPEDCVKIGVGCSMFIDHQSNCTEGSCMEPFASEETLYDFLRYEESYIEGGNDNE